jgi:hypothetical protein
MSAMPLTPAQKNAAFRARKAAEGISEVRGIWLAPKHHEKLKRLAQTLADQKKAKHAD